MRAVMPLLVALTFAIPAMAQERYFTNGEARPLEYFVDGNGLHRFCQSEPEFAHGYVVGIVERLLSTQELNSLRRHTDDSVHVPTVCLPDAVVTTQLRDVACKYLREHPEERHEHASYLVARSMATAFPCLEYLEQMREWEEQKQQREDGMSPSDLSGGGPRTPR